MDFKFFLVPMVQRGGRFCPELASILGQDYINEVNNLTQFAPLSEVVRNLSVHDVALDLDLHIAEFENDFLHINHVAMHHACPIRDLFVERFR